MGAIAASCEICEPKILHSFRLGAKEVKKVKLKTSHSIAKQSHLRMYYWVLYHHFQDYSCVR